MSSTDSASEAFNSSLQTAIFNFATALAVQYGQTMSQYDAVCKAGNWLISLGERMKEIAGDEWEKTQSYDKLLHDLSEQGE